MTDIDLWLTELKELGHVLQQQMQNPDDVRANRVDKSKFFGCDRFPACREPLPIEYDQKPALSVIESLGLDKDRQNGKGYSKNKNPAMNSPERQKPTTRKSAGSASDGSWKRDEQSDKDKNVNTNLSREEMAAILEMTK